jgi:hypothetical protein
MQTKVKGDISEAKALLEFQKRNIPVAIPWGDKERYDMIIELNNQFYRIQVKTANEEENDGTVKCYTRSSHDHTTHKNYFTYDGQVDYFVFYNMKRDAVAIVPIEDVKDQQSLSLRFTPPKNNQKNVRYWNDCSLEKILCVEPLPLPCQLDS